MNAVLMGICPDALALAKIIQKADNYPNNNGIKIDGVLCRDLLQTTKIAMALNIKAYTGIDDALRNADILFISQPDSKLARFIETLKSHNVRNKILCHFSDKYDSSVLSCGITNSCYSVSIPYRYETKNISEIIDTPIFIEGEGKNGDEFKEAFSNSVINLYTYSKNEKHLTSMAKRKLTNYLKVVISSSRHFMKFAGTYHEKHFINYCRHLFDDIYYGLDNVQKLDPPTLKRNLKIVSSLNYGESKKLVKNMEAHIAANANYSFEEKTEIDRILKS